MIRNVLENIGGVGLYGIISICLFFLVFSGAVLRAMLMKSTEVDMASALPLESDECPFTNAGGNHHE